MADNVFEPEVRKSLAILQDYVYREGLDIPSIAIECKKTQSAYFGFEQLKDHQLESLFQFKEKGYAQKMLVASAPGYTKSRFHGTTPFDFLLTGRGLSFLLVNFRFTKKAPRKDIPKGTNRCFAVTPEQYQLTKERYIAEGRASIPYEWFVEEAIECARIRYRGIDGKYSYCWDLSVLVPNVKLV